MYTFIKEDGTKVKVTMQQLLQIAKDQKQEEEEILFGHKRKPKSAIYEELNHRVPKKRKKRPRR